MFSPRTARQLGFINIFIAVVVGCVSQPADETRQPERILNKTATISTSVNKPPDGVSGNEQQNQQPPSRDDTTQGEEIIGGKKLSIPKITGSVPPRDDEYHDTDNNAIVVLQSPAKAMADFPRDRRNEVNWVKALDEGFIAPRADLLGKTQMVTMDMDILMKNTQFMPWVKFPHIAHTKWLACENCHPKIFIPQEGANPISMNKVLRGEFCGVCHDKVAFSLFVCERCHSVPHEGSGPAWWK